MATVFNYTIGSTNLISVSPQSLSLSALINLRVLWTEANDMFYHVNCLPVAGHLYLEAIISFVYKL